MMKKTIYLLLVSSLFISSCKKVSTVTDVYCRDPFRLCSITIEEQVGLELPTAHVMYRSVAWVNKTRISIGDEIDSLVNAPTINPPDSFTAWCNTYHEIYAEDGSVVYEAACLPEPKWVSYIPSQRFISKSKPELGKEFKFIASEWAPGGFVSKYKKEKE